MSRPGALDPHCQAHGFADARVERVNRNLRRKLSNEKALCGWNAAHNSTVIIIIITVGKPIQYDRCDETNLCVSVASL